MNHTSYIRKSCGISRSFFLYALFLLRTEDTVAGVAETGNYVTVVI